MGTRAPMLGHPGAGYAAGLLGVAAVTWAVDLASGEVNVLSMAVCFQLLVLVVSGAAGLGPGLVTSLASALAFNFFFVPPLHTFTISDTRNWVSLAVFAATAAITSYLAGGFRRQRAEAEERRRDAELLGEVARAALGGVGTAAVDDEVARAAARALGVEWCTIVRDAGTARDAADPVHLRPRAGGFTVPLVAGGRPLGLLQVGPARADQDARRSTPGFAAAVADLVAVAIERSRLVAAELEAEGLRRSDELKTALLHGVSHEFRTPLTAIRTAAHALDDPARGRAEPLGVLRVETDRLDRLVANLLDLSRLEAGALTARMDWCAPAEMVAGAVEAAEPFLAGLRVEIDAPSDLPLVRADPVLCERILVNLIHNAVRHGAPPVRVMAALVEGRVDIVVEDAGPGLDPDVAAHPFDPFVAGARSGGTGVGLALSRGLADAQGVWLKSAPGSSGARFVLSFTPVATPVPIA